MVYIRIPLPEEPLPMTVLVEVEPPPVPIPPEMQIPVPPEESLLAATRVDSDEKAEELNDPMAGELVGDAVPDDPEDPVKLQDWIPNTTDAAELAALSQEAAELGKKLNERRSELQQSITRQQVSSAAKDFELNSDGGVQGAVRLLDVEGFPLEDVIPVLKRYGITYERRNTSPSSGRSFLNAARTADGTFTNAEAKPGAVYEVMVLSAKAVSMMATREVEALIRDGFDPVRSRVRKIVFGIVRQPDGTLDLDVVSLDAEQIR
jgi:hypothetical protein